MELFQDIFQFFVNIPKLGLDGALTAFVKEHQTFTYALLGLIIFCETGLVVTPFLPGDSLLFAAGAITAGPGSEYLSLPILMILLFACAIAGDNVNYFIGKWIAKQGSEKKLFGLFTIRKDYLKKTHDFYEKHGGRTIILARFVPIVRTFAPFVAGVGAMEYRKYIWYCLVGGALWVSLLSGLGYAFGETPLVKNNFELVILGIIGISLLPVIFEIWRNFRKKA